MSRWNGSELITVLVRDSDEHARPCVRDGLAAVGWAQAYAFNRAAVKRTIAAKLRGHCLSRHEHVWPARNVIDSENNKAAVPKVTPKFAATQTTLTPDSVEFSLFVIVTVT